MAETPLQLALRQVIKYVLLIVVVSVFAWIIPKLPGFEDIRLWRMSFAGWISVLKSIALAVIIFLMIRPTVQATKAFSRKHLSQSIRKPEVVGHVVDLLGVIVVLIGVFVLYSILVPAVNLLVSYQILFDWFPSVVKVGFLLVGIYILYLLWKAIEPLIGSASDAAAKIAEKADNRRDQTSGRDGDISVCPDCGKDLDPGARFCRYCGAALNGQSKPHE